MTVDKFGRSPKTVQNVRNVARVSHEYVNSNLLRKGQAIDSWTGQRSGRVLVTLGALMIRLIDQMGICPAVNNNKQTKK